MIHQRTIRIMHEVADERTRQDEKWGEQNHPLVDPLLVSQGRTGVRMAEEYEVPTAGRAQLLCQAAAERGEVTWMHIALEELCEFMLAAGTDPVEARAELVQLAAVAVAAIECIDRHASQRPAL